MFRHIMKRDLKREKTMNFIIQIFVILVYPLLRQYNGEKSYSD